MYCVETVGAPLIGFLIIFGAALGGYAGLALWTIGAATIGLASLSYAERHMLLKRASERGLSELADSTLLSSAFNAFCATGAAYGCGLLLRAISLP
jgi:hypothetical protein